MFLAPAMVPVTGLEMASATELEMALNNYKTKKKRDTGV